MADTQDQSAFLDPSIWTNQIQQQGQQNQPYTGQPAAGVNSNTLPASFGGPVPPGQVPPPSVGTQVVYTDASGKGYNPNELAAAMQDPTFMNDPLNARTRDILPQYHTVLGTPMAPTQQSAPSAPAAAAPAARSNVGAATAQNDPRASAFYDALLSRIGGINENVGANDPIIKGQTDAYAANAERANRSALARMAERGGSSSNFDAVSRALAEKAGQATAGFSANLMGDERSQRRQEIQNLLSLGGGFLTQQQQMSLQQELHQLDLQQRAYEYDSDYAYKTSPFAAAFEA